MQAKKIFKWASISLVALMLIAGIGLFTLDLGFLRPTIEKRVSEMTGRDFSVGEGFSIKLGKELRIQVQDLRLANAPWAESGDLVRIDKASLVIETRSLWNGPVVIRHIESEGMSLLLIQNEAGQSNWVFGEESPVPEAAETALPFLLQTVDMSNARIEFRSPKLDQPLVAEISELHEAVDVRGMIESHLVGKLNGKAVAFNGTAGPYDRLLSGDNIELAGDGQFGNIQLSGRASLDNLYLPRQPEIELRLEGPELEELTQMLGIEGMGGGPISLLATTTVLEGVLNARLEGTLGEFKTDVTANADSLQSFENAKVVARVNGPNFGRIARLAGQEGWPEKPFDVSADIHREGPALQITKMNMSLAGAKIEMQGTLPAFPELAGANVTLSVKGPDLAPFRKGLGFADLPAGAFSISGDISSPADTGTVVALNYNTPLARGKVSGAIGAGADMLGTDLVIRAQGDDATAVGKMLELPGMSPAPWTLALDMRIDDAAYYNISSMAFETQGLKFGLKGRVGSVDIASKTAVEFSVSGKRLADFQAMVGDSPELPAQPFSLAGQVESQAGGWKLHEVRGQAGPTSISLSGVLGSGDKLDGTDLVILANGSGLEGFLGPDSAVKLPAGPFELRTGIAANNGQLKLNQIDFTAGPLKIKGDVQSAWPPGLEGSRFSMDIAGEDISRVLPELAGLKLDPQAYTAQLKGAFQSELYTIEQGRISVGKNQLNLEGTFNPPPDLSSTNIKLTFEAPDLSKLGTFNDTRWQSVPFSLRTSFSGTGEKLNMSQFDAQLGASKVNGSLEVDFGGKVPAYVLRMTTAELDLRPFLSELAAQPELSKEEQKNARLIPELDLPMETLALANGSFDLSTGKIVLKESQLADFRLTGTTADGKLSVSELGADGFSGRLLMTLELAPAAGQSARLSTTIRSTGFVPRSSLMSAEEQKLSPAYDTDIRLQGSGATVRAAAASLDGDITIKSAGGQLHNRKQTSKRRAMLAKIVSAISPNAARQNVVNISCLAVVIKAVDGKLKLDPGVAVQSDKLNIFAKGNVDLATEKVDVSFSTQTRKSVDVSASELFSPYVKLTGTLGSPSVGIDPKGTLLSGGAAYLSGGLSLLAKKALDTISSDNPCGDTLREAAPADQP